MGFLDDLKKAAANVASDAGKAGKVAQLQIKLRALQNDVGDAQKELGIVAYDLVARGAVAHAELDPLVAKVREAQALVAEKEAEIAETRAHERESGEASGQTTGSQEPPADAQS